MIFTLQEHLGHLPPGDFLPVFPPPLPLHGVHLYAFRLPISINVPKCNRIPITIFTLKKTKIFYHTSENGSHLIIAQDIRPWCVQNMESFSLEWPLG